MSLLVHLSKWRDFQSGDPIAQNDNKSACCWLAVWVNDLTIILQGCEISDFQNSLSGLQSVLDYRLPPPRPPEITDQLVLGLISSAEWHSGDATLVCMVVRYLFN